MFTSLVKSHDNMFINTTLTALCQLSKLRVKRSELLRLSKLTSLGVGSSSLGSAGGAMLLALV